MPYRDNTDFFVADTLRVHTAMMPCNTNRNNSVPLKKVDRRDFGILSEKCEQHEREQGSRESKSFPIKVLYLFLYN